MDLLLWRWSTAVQVTSIVMIVVFFAVLRRSSRREDTGWWLAAWSANLVALTVTLLFWVTTPGPAVLPAVGAAYGVAKTAFVLCLMQGAWTLVRPGAVLIPPRALAATLGVYALVLLAAVDSIARLGVYQHAVLGVTLLAGAATLAYAGLARVPWLVAGLSVRGLLAIAEAGAYLTQLPGAGQADSRVAIFLAAHSSLDSAAEWLIVLGSVLALSGRAERELQQTNAQLLDAYDGLRALADRDPLTTLANRRALPEFLRAVHRTGAVLLFFDLDGFKRVNDRHGHLAGDDCLRRFAAALRESFRPEDAVVRYGGDEFLVIAAGLDPVAVDARVADVRRRLAEGTVARPRIAFSVGVGMLPPEGSAEAALQMADAAMYRAKRHSGVD